VLALPSLGRQRQVIRQTRMTIVIQDIETRRFYAGEEQWVGDAHEALSFSDTRHALQFCRRHGLDGVRLVVFFQNHKVSLLLYVPGSDTPAPAGRLPAVS